ncbi:MAG: 50S ribosomal protein L6 [bacterium]
MSKVGLLPINIPAGVTVTLVGSVVKVSGSKGNLELTLPKGIDFKIEGSVINITRQNDEKPTRALHGTVRANLNNLAIGVSTGFKKSLELVGTGYRARMQGNKLVLSLGFSHEIEYAPKSGITIAVEGTNLIHITGSDIQAVGQTAAEIRKYRKPEPYKGKGVKYVGEVIRRKAGKAAKGASA